MSFLRRLGSLHVTFVLLLTLAAAVVWGYLGEEERPLAVVGALAALEANLLAAIVANPAFRRQLPLLVFHLSLAAIVLLAAIGRMTYLRGATEITVGERFEGLLERTSGPWHPDRLDRVVLVNEGFEVSYHPGPIRDRTVNRVRWLDGSGAERSEVIGDIRSVEIYGYRFSTTSNKGFAPVFEWTPTGNTPVVGSVHLPSYPTNEETQWREWQLPGLAQPVLAGVVFEGPLLPPDRDSVLRVPTTYRIFVRLGDTRHELKPGESVQLPQGNLKFIELRMWMGYSVFFDLTIPWLLGASVLAVLALCWHFQQKFAKRSWQR